MQNPREGLVRITESNNTCDTFSSGLSCCVVFVSCAKLRFSCLFYMCVQCFVCFNDDFVADMKYDWNRHFSEGAKMFVDVVVKLMLQPHQILWNYHSCRISNHLFVYVEKQNKKLLNHLIKK